MAKKKAVKRKLEIVFDPEKRKEFLTGFPKRKNERRKRAREDMERNLKEERKRIRQEVKNGMKNLKKSFEPLRELTEEDRKDGGEIQQRENEYEDDDVKVKIVEITTAELARSRNLLGVNKDETSDEEVPEKNEESEDDDDCNVNSIPGMDLDVKKAKQHKNTNKSQANGNNGDEANEETQNAENHKNKYNKYKNLELKSKKDLDRFTSKKMRNKLKQSKAFRLKERVQKKANQKQAKRERNNTLKSLPKGQRKKKKLEPTRYRKGRMVNKKQARRTKD